MNSLQSCVSAVVLLLALSIEKKEVLGDLSNFEVKSPNKIYHSFPTHPRENQPDGQVKDAGECCMLFDHVTVPVGSSATFTSPNFPKSYPSDMICGWNFTTESGYTFDMHCHFSHLKRSDFFTMWDQVYNLFSYIENVREKEVYHYFRSNAVQVGFHSDDEMSARGFECSIWPVKSNCDAGSSSISYFRYRFVEEFIPGSESFQPCTDGQFLYPKSRQQYDAFQDFVLNYYNNSSLPSIWLPLKYVDGKLLNSSGEVKLEEGPLGMDPWHLDSPAEGIECVAFKDMGAAPGLISGNCTDAMPRVCAEEVEACEEDVDRSCFIYYNF